MDRAILAPPAQPTPPPKKKRAKPRGPALRLDPPKVETEFTNSAPPALLVPVLAPINHTMRKPDAPLLDLRGERAACQLTRDAVAQRNEWMRLLSSYWFDWRIAEKSTDAQRVRGRIERIGAQYQGLHWAFAVNAGRAFVLLGLPRPRALPLRMVAGAWGTDRLDDRIAAVRCRYSTISRFAALAGAGAVIALSTVESSTAPS